MPSDSRRSRSNRHPSSSRSRSHHQSSNRSRSHRSNTNSRTQASTSINPLRFCKLTFIGPVVQALLLFVIPASICAILFLAGIWKFSVFVLVDTGRRYKIGSKGYKVDDVDVGYHKYLYDNPWPTPVHSLPSLLLAHLILAVLLAALLLTLVMLAIHAVRNRLYDQRRRDAIVTVMRRPPLWTRLLTILLTLCVGTLLSLDNAIWGVSQQQKSLDLKPDILGYFLCIVSFILWFCWVVLQLASTQDRQAYYVAGKRVYV